MMAPHFVLVPGIGHGHTVPMVDLGFLLAERGARVSLVTTLGNAATLPTHLTQGVVEIVELPLPAAADDDGVPPDLDDFLRFFLALSRLAGPLEAYVRALPRRPSCIISDYVNPWTAGVARSVAVPRLSLCASSCFYSLCDLLHRQRHSAGEASYVVPGIPVRVEMTKDTWSSAFFTTPGAPAWEAFMEEAREGIRTADGAVVNTFLDLEEQFVERYKEQFLELELEGQGRSRRRPVWALGPFFLQRHRHDNHQRQSIGSDIDVTAWLDAISMGDPRGGAVVIYVNFGSLVRMLPKQLYEVGHGLEDSGKPFLWVVKESEEVEESWLQALEARTGRGLVVRGWAHQVAILSHPAVGGFVTHCGWNSLLESMAHGVPVVTWPHFGDQFLNERLAVDVLGVGVPVVDQLAAEAGRLVRRGDVARAVSELMGDGEVAQERRRKAKEYGERAHRAMEKGGSSYENLTQLVQSFTRSASAMD